MQVYHGSYTEIFEIDLAKSKSNKDFGSCFYVTKFRNHAENWATNFARRYNKKPFVTEFTFYERAFEEDRYKVLRFNDYNEDWLDFVVLNRNPAFTTNQHDYDLVEGPIADDKVQNRINDFLDGIITKKVFLNELKYHENTHQICFCTINSLQLLKKTDTKYTSYVVRISEPVIENLITDLDIDEEKAADIFYTSKTFSLLSDKSTELYKKTWQEIYERLKTELVNKQKQ
ncbi:MAG: DUF3990 domain-containing protein [Chitinophagaceae bacterium]|jgi:hypothetical protein|nr:DUF3990 domain-containing protein [Chitinophagaceae bacterium]